jgi:hypothetical protein
LGSEIFDIGSKAAAKNKWIAFEKDLVKRKVEIFFHLSQNWLFFLCSSHALFHLYFFPLFFQVESVQDEVKNLLARINSGEVLPNSRLDLIFYQCLIM